MASVVLAFIALVSAGCVSPTTHAWQLCGDDFAVRIPIDQWPMLPADQYARVDPEQIDRAVSRLSNESFLPLRSDDVPLFCKTLKPPKDSTMRPFLVRGVACGGVPTYTVLRYERATRQLAVHHATYDGENLVTAYAVRKAMPIALVVYLPAPPTAVYVTAGVGGDGIPGRAAAENLDTR